jgi:hypothetical protein
LGGVREGVGDGDAYAAVAYVEAKDAPVLLHGVSLVEWGRNEGEIKVKSKNKARGPSLRSG